MKTISVLITLIMAGNATVVDDGEAGNATVVDDGEAGNDTVIDDAAEEAREEEAREEEAREEEAAAEGCADLEWVEEDDTKYSDVMYDDQWDKLLVYAKRDVEEDAKLKCEQTEGCAGISCWWRYCWLYSSLAIEESDLSFTSYYLDCNDPPPPAPRGHH